MIVAEKGVEKVTGKTGSIYPLKTMEVGESFIVPENKKGNRHYGVAKSGSVRFAPKKFEAGADAQGNKRVWRTA